MIAIKIRHMPQRAKLLLRGRSRDNLFVTAVEEVTGLSLPVEPNSSMGIEPALLWLSPTGWLLLGRGDELRCMAAALQERLQDRDGDLIDVSDEYEHFSIQGSASGDLMATCCPVDLSENAFPQGAVARTLAASVGVIVHRPVGAAELDLYVDRSYRHHLWDALHAQAREFV